MSTWFKGFFLGIGILLGLAEPREPPQMTVLLHRNADSIYASAEVSGLPGKALEELVDASFGIRLVAVLWVDTYKTTVWRSISFDGLEYSVEMSETGIIHRTSSANAAWIMASRFIGIPMGTVASLSRPLKVVGSVAIAMADEGSGDDPMVLLGYRPAMVYRQLDSLDLVPYH